MDHFHNQMKEADMQVIKTKVMHHKETAMCTHTLQIGNQNLYIEKKSLRCQRIWYFRVDPCTQTEWAHHVCRFIEK